VTQRTLARGVVLKPTGLPVNQYIECTRCLEASRDDSDVTGWAEGHQAKRPGHDSFRTVNTASWRLVPRGEGHE
jgi:hypothetical protein